METKNNKRSKFNETQIKEKEKIEEYYLRIQ